MHVSAYACGRVCTHTPVCSCRPDLCLHMPLLEAEEDTLALCLATLGAGYK